MSEPKIVDDVSQQEASSDNASLYEPIDPGVEKKLVRKLDMYIIPVYMIIYIFSFLDRSNIGNAKVAGMATALHLGGSEFNGETRETRVLTQTLFIPSAYSLFNAISGGFDILRYLHCFRNSIVHRFQNGRS